MLIPLIHKHAIAVESVWSGAKDMWNTSPTTSIALSTTVNILDRDVRSLYLLNNGNRVNDLLGQDFVALVTGGKFKEDVKISRFNWQICQRPRPH